MVTVGRIGLAIRTLRQSYGLTQVQLGERIGVGRVTIVKVKRGELGTAAGICLGSLNELGRLDDVEAIRNGQNGPDVPEAPGRL